jgi:RNA methyltransferase, TrmH family
VFVVEGLALLQQAVAAGWTVEAQFVPRGGEAIDDASPVHECAPNVIERVASTESPKPLLAVVHQRRTALPADAQFAVVADRLSDPGNAGTIIRSAEAAGADVVVFTPGSVDAYNSKVVRSSAGSLFRIPVVEAELGDVAATGLRLLATSSHHGEVYTDASLSGRVAIVVGNEAHGVPADAPVDGWLTIPHAGAVESLNVAMAATVLAFEVARQRRPAR